MTRGNSSRLSIAALWVAIAILAGALFLLKG